MNHRLTGPPVRLLLFKRWVNNYTSQLFLLCHGLCLILLMFAFLWINVLTLFPQRWSDVFLVICCKLCHACIAMVKYVYTRFEFFISFFRSFNVTIFALDTSQYWLLHFVIMNVCVSVCVFTQRWNLLQLNQSLVFENKHPLPLNFKQQFCLTINMETKDS